MLRIAIAVSLLLVAGAGAAADKRVPTSRPIVVDQAVTPAKAKRLAETVWPALSQREVDDITARAKAAGKNTVRIFCFDEVKCGDLTSSLENAFESAHWTVEVRYTPSMIPPGMLASPKVIKALSTIDPGFSLAADPEPEAIESITIGEKPKGRLE